MPKKKHASPGNGSAGVDVALLKRDIAALYEKTSGATLSLRIRCRICMARSHWPRVPKFQYLSDSA